MSSGDWLCGSCQHWNFKKRDYCQKCGYSKSGDGVYVDTSPMVKPGDWYCANCEAHNFARRTNCHKCGGNMRSSAPAAPQRGDWICAGCGMHNYASRMECLKCRKQRDYGDTVF